MRTFSVGKEIYHHGNHPIKWVRITGVIIAVDEFSARRVFTVDDSSGICIECTCPAPSPTALAVPAHLNQASSIKPVGATGQNPKSEPTMQPSTPSVETPLVPWEDMDVGVVVKIKGKPNKFRDVKQIDIIKVEVIRSTEQEVRCWNEVLAFRTDVLQVPWVVSREAEAKYRRRAERGKYKQRSMKHGKSNGDRKGVEKRSNSKDKVTQKQKKSDHSSEDREKEERRPSKKRKHDLDEGLKAENKANYPSLAVRKKLAGKYDALGI